MERQRPRAQRAVVTPRSDSEGSASAASGRGHGAGQRPALTAEHKALFEAVAQVWADHQGWKPDQWPANRRYDAIQIQRWTRRLWPLSFWSEVIRLIPRGNHMTYLTMPPKPGQAPRIEQLYVKWREGHWEQEKKEHATEFHSVGEVLRRIVENKGASSNA